MYCIDEIMYRLSLPYNEISYFRNKKKLYLKISHSEGISIIELNINCIDHSGKFEFECNEIYFIIFMAEVLKLILNLVDVLISKIDRWMIYLPYKNFSENTEAKLFPFPLA